MGDGHRYAEGKKEGQARGQVEQRQEHATCAMGAGGGCLSKG